MSKEAMKLALEALDHNSLFTSLMPGYDGRVIEKAYKAINKALAEQQEPVAWTNAHGDVATNLEHLKFGKGTIPLYTSPPAQRKPLTDEQIDALREKHSEGRGAGWRFDFKGFARAIEAAHGIKEKNT